MGLVVFGKEELKHVVERLVSAIALGEMQNKVLEKRAHQIGETAVDGERDPVRARAAVPAGLDGLLDHGEGDVRHRQAEPFGIVREVPVDALLRGHGRDHIGDQVSLRAVATVFSPEVTY